MAITDRTCKMLWGLAANRCAVCKAELVFDATDLDREALIGDECHISSPRPGGPRYDPLLPSVDADSYDNLVLLCRNHHGMVDEQPLTHTAEALRRLKAEHERWVREHLTSTPREPRATGGWRRKSAPDYLARIETGTELLNLVLGVHAYEPGFDEVKTQQEVELVGGFLQAAQDYGELGDELGPYERVQASKVLSELIEELDSAGFFVFGGREIATLETDAGSGEDLTVAILRVTRKTSDEVIKVRLAGAADDPQMGPAQGT